VPLSDLFPPLWAEQPAEIIREVWDAVAEHMSLRPGVDDVEVTWEILSHLHGYHQAVHADVRGWFKKSKRKEVLEELSAVAALSEELRRSIESLSVFARIHLRGQISIADPDERAVWNTWSDRLELFRSTTGQDWPAGPGQSINIEEVSCALSEIESRCQWAAQTITVPKGGRPREDAQRVFAGGVWSIWCLVCDERPSAPQPTYVGMALS
jgi:hypothetical protein